LSELKIACLGDTMCGDSFCCPGDGVASSLQRYGVDFLSSDIADYLQEHDLTLCNLESVLSDVGRNDYLLRRVHMRGRPEAAQYLSQWGIDVANVANNHILEQGHEAAVDTVRQLQAAGIKAVGAGKDGRIEPGLQVVEMEQSGQSIAVIGMCLLQEKYTFNGGAGLCEVIEAIKTLSKQGKLVIVSIHWGYEQMNRPSLDQKKIGRGMVQAGAVLIIGHHSHVVQGVEQINGSLIAYSMGNFIYDSFSPGMIWSMILRVRLSGRKIEGWEIRPIENGRDHRPRFAQDQRKNELEQQIRRRCEFLEVELPEKAYAELYNLEYRLLDDWFRRRLRKELLKRFGRVSPIYWPQILWRPIQRRLGWW